MKDENQITKTNDKVEEYKKTKTLTLAERMNILKVNKDTCLLIDVSISMGAPAFINVNGEGKDKSRYDLTLETLEKFPAIRKFVFSRDCHEILEGDKIPSPNGSTALDLGFKRVSEKGLKHIVLLTDGQPNDEHAALSAARAIKDLKLNIIYIGPKPIPLFLTQLANAVNGTFDDVALISGAAQKTLESKIKGYLT